MPRKSSLLPKSLTTVTTFSKALAFILFITLPFVGFSLGIKYDELISATSDAFVTTSSLTQASNPMTGIYVGKLPCADCSGITETLDFNPDMTYTKSDLYNGKSPTPYIEHGTWTLISDIYTLTDSKNSPTAHYQLKDGKTLVPLDVTLKPITSPFDMSLKRE